MIEAYFDEIQKAYNFYFNIGGKAHIAVFFIAVIVTVCLTKSKRDRYINYLLPLMIVFLIMLNPLVVLFLSKGFSYSIYRIYWLIFPSVVVASAVCEILERCDETKRLFSFILLLLAVLVTGQVVGVRGKLYPIQNMYRIDDQVMEIADVINSYSDEKKAVVPESVAWQIRQYSDIKLLYGRLNKTQYVKSTLDAYNAINQNIQGSEDIITQTADETEFPFIVLNKGTADEERMEQYGFKKIAATEDYDVYKKGNS